MVSINGQDHAGDVPELAARVIVRTLIFIAGDISGGVLIPLYDCTSSCFCPLFFCMPAVKVLDECLMAFS